MTGRFLSMTTKSHFRRWFCLPSFVTNKNIRMLFIAAMALLMFLTGCSDKKTYSYEEGSVVSIEIKEMTENGSVLVSKVAEEEQGSFLSELSKITFKKDRDQRKEAPELVIVITFANNEYHKISYFSLDEYTSDGRLKSRQNYVCSQDTFLSLINKYKE